jgi:two-component system sensor histidine kinase YesM
VENALYHGFEEDEGGAIEVNITKEKNSILLRVRDNGRGMPEDKQKELFEDEDEQLRKSGLGIGLRYVKKMLTFYYGSKSELNVESGIGLGTTISIRLPDTLEGAEALDTGSDRG